MQAVIWATSATEARNSISIIRQSVNTRWRSWTRIQTTAWKIRFSIDRTIWMSLKPFGKLKPSFTKNSHPNSKKRFAMWWFSTNVRWNLKKDWFRFANLKADRLKLRSMARKNWKPSAVVYALNHHLCSKSSRFGRGWMMSKCRAWLCQISNWICSVFPKTIHTENADCCKKRKKCCLPSWTAKKNSRKKKF